jgi:hypothetical protein
MGEHRSPGIFSGLGLFIFVGSGSATATRYDMLHILRSFALAIGLPGVVSGRAATCPRAGPLRRNGVDYDRDDPARRDVDNPLRFHALHSRQIDHLRLPENVSGKLPSRGQVAVRGTINGHEFQAVLEPDGSGGHWMMSGCDTPPV